MKCDIERIPFDGQSYQMTPRWLTCITSCGKCAKNIFFPENVKFIFHENRPRLNEMLRKTFQFVNSFAEDFFSISSHEDVKEKVWVKLKMHFSVFSTFLFQNILEHERKFEKRLSTLLRAIVEYSKSGTVLWSLWKLWTDGT